MDATQAAEAVAAQEPTVEAEVTPTTEEPTEEVLPSDEPEPVEETSREELLKQIDGLEAKVKRGADKASDVGREAKEASEAQTQADNVDSFYGEHMEDIINGKLSDEGIARAEELGMTEDQMELDALRTEKMRSNIYGKAGGKEAYDALINDVKDSYDDSVKDAYSRVISAEPELAEILIAGLKAKQGNQSSKPSLSNGAIASGNGSQGYSNSGEYAKDMAAYRNAPSSRQASIMNQIQAKVSKSNSSVLMGR